MRTLKIWQIVSALLFIIFAIVQYNDPDAMLWIFIYLTIAVLILLYEKISKGVLSISLLIYLIFLLTYIPAVIDWINSGTPSVTGSMKAESPFIELVREAGGLVICTFTLWALWRKKR